jgi:glutathione-independent formaldehyde dehydrogenase
VQNNRYGVGIPEVDCFVDCVGFTEASGHGANAGKKAGCCFKSKALPEAGGSIEFRVVRDGRSGATDEASKQGNLKIRFD